MLNTKYVRLRDGTIVIFSEGLGYDHFSASCLITDNDDVIDAGFVYIDEHDRFCVYGHSLSLNVRSDPFAAQDMQDALMSGRMMTRSLNECDFYAVVGRDGEIVNDVNDLYSRKIFRKET